jgi:hypothetical protein
MNWKKNTKSVYPMRRFASGCVPWITVGRHVGEGRTGADGNRAIRKASSSIWMAVLILGSDQNIRRVVSSSAVMTPPASHYTGDSSLKKIATVLSKSAIMSFASSVCPSPFTWIEAASSSLRATAVSIAVRTIPN